MVFEKGENAPKRSGNFNENLDSICIILFISWFCWFSSGDCVKPMTLEDWERAGSNDDQKCPFWVTKKIGEQLAPFQYLSPSQRHPIKILR